MFQQLLCRSVIHYQPAPHMYQAIWLLHSFHHSPTFSKQCTVFKPELLNVTGRPQTSWVRVKQGTCDTGHYEIVPEALKIIQCLDMHCCTVTTHALHGEKQISSHNTRHWVARSNELSSSHDQSCRNRPSPDQRFLPPDANSPPGPCPCLPPPYVITTAATR